MGILDVFSRIVYGPASGRGKPRLRDDSALKDALGKLRRQGALGVPGYELLLRARDGYYTAGVLKNGKNWSITKHGWGSWTTEWD